MTIVAVDDEPLALQLITRYIEETPELALLMKFKNPLEAAGFLKENSVDIVMLDIQMPELNGIEFARQMTSGPKVIPLLPIRSTSRGAQPPSGPITLLAGTEP